jgi:hypothetical protein
MVLVANFWSYDLASAALGGTVATIDVDRDALQAVHRATTTRQGYSVAEVMSDASTVREYVSPSGVVFGISWNGYVHPDLTQLLGSYWGEYSNARQKVAREFGRKRLHIATGHIVVEKWGHMRNLQGRAYVPSLVPKGVSIDAIR